MKYIKKIAPLVSALFLCASVQAADPQWLLVFRGSNHHMVTFVEKNTFERKGDEITLWTLRQMDEIGAPVNMPEVRSMRIHQKYNCKSRKSQALQVSFSDADERVLVSDHTPHESTDIGPSTVEDGYWALSANAVSPITSPTRSFWSVMK